jgi:hypothetical protein
MQIKKYPKTKEGKVKRLVESCFIFENIKLAKQLVQQGKLSEEELQKLVSIDPTPNKKYVGWLAKVWIAEKPSIDDMRNKIEEFNTLLNKGKTKTKDIFTFKTFQDLVTEVDEINERGTGLSVKELENDYEVVVDNENLYIAVPHTHEASRKLGLSAFAFRSCPETGGKDSSWCTTYKAPDHFNDYYYNHGVTFYYIRVKSPKIIGTLKATFPVAYKQLEVVALAVLPSGKIDGYDGLDKQMSTKVIEEFRKIIGI